MAKPPPFMRTCGPSAQLRLNLFRGCCACLLLASFGCGVPATTATHSKVITLNCNELAQADQSPLAHHNHLTLNQISVDDMPGPVDDWEPNTDRVAGVEISVPADPGVTRASLERQLICYRQVARPSTTDPLLVPETQIAVSEGRGSFEVLVTSTDAQVAEHVVRAARTIAQSDGAAPLASR